VALVDLRGREEEPEVRSLLGDVDPAGVATIGWEDGGTLDACAVVKRDDGDLRILALAGPDAATAALVDALADIVNARRLLAADGRVVRTLDATPASAAAVRATTLAGLEAAIRSAWAADTSANPNWSDANPASGQCDVTALLVRELLGGDILVANVIRDGDRLERHAWNRLPGGVDVDLTRGQYREGEQLGDPRVEEPLGLARGRERFERFSERVRAALGD